MATTMAVPLMLPVVVPALAVDMAVAQQELQATELEVASAEARVRQAVTVPGVQVMRRESVPARAAVAAADPKGALVAVAVLGLDPAAVESTEFSFSEQATAAGASPAIVSAHFGVVRVTEFSLRVGGFRFLCYKNLSGIMDFVNVVRVGRSACN